MASILASVVRKALGKEKGQRMWPERQTGPDCIGLECQAKEL